jgi:hypothetical protein
MINKSCCTSGINILFYIILIIGFQLDKEFYIFTVTELAI